MTIELQGVSKRFGRTDAVADVDVTFHAGSLTAVLGPSGCGKSTLLRVIGGYEIPDRGRVAIDGKDVTQLPLRRRNAGFVFQHGALFPHLSVAENVGFGLAVRGVSRAARRARVAELLELVQLGGFEARRPHELSGGQRQRVAFARALAAEPPILLLDEPFSALDVHVRRELRGWLREWHERTAVTTVFVTHDADEAMELADAVVVLRDGRVEQAGTPTEVYESPVNAFVLGFLGPANVIGAPSGGAFVRPHEFRVGVAPFDGAYRASIERIVVLAGRARYECRLENGDAIVVEIPDAHEPSRVRERGETLYVSPSRARSFLAEVVA